METITVDLEKILDMIIGNEGIRQFGTGGNYGRVVFNKFNVGYYNPSPGTEYPNDYDVSPEDFIDIDEIEKDYPLDLGDFRSTAKEIVSKENEIEVDDFEEEDWDKVSEYEQESLDEWKARARGELKDILQVRDSEDTVIAEFKIVWE